AASQAQWTPASWRNDSPAPSGGTAEPRQNPKPVEPLSLDQARRIASRFAHGLVGNVEIVDTDSGPLISSTLTKMVMKNCCLPERIPAKTATSGGLSCSYQTTNALTRCR